MGAGHGKKMPKKKMMDMMKKGKKDDKKKQYNGHMEQKTQVCRMCGRERDIEKFALYQTKTFGLSRQKICLACRGVKGRAKLRLEFLEVFGWKCSCCGEKIFQFLTIEHKNKDGAKHRREIGGGKRLIEWIL